MSVAQQRIIERQDLELYRMHQRLAEQRAADTMPAMSELNWLQRTGRSMRSTGGDMRRTGNSMMLTGFGLTIGIIILIVIIAILL